MVKRSEAQKRDVAQVKKENVLLEGEEFSRLVSALAMFAKRIASEAAEEALAKAGHVSRADSQET